MNKKERLYLYKLLERMCKRECWSLELTNAFEYLLWLFKICETKKGYNMVIRFLTELYDSHMEEQK